MNRGNKASGNRKKERQKERTFRLTSPNHNSYYKTNTRVFCLFLLSTEFQLRLTPGPRRDASRAVSTPKLLAIERPNNEGKTEQKPKLKVCYKCCCARTSKRTRNGGEGETWRERTGTGGELKHRDAKDDEYYSTKIMITYFCLHAIFTMFDPRFLRVLVFVRLTCT